MHPPEVKAAALELVAQGFNDCEISRGLGVPRRTILGWRRPTYVPRNPEIPRETCPRCWRAAKPMQFTAADYSELLAVYLGDGCITEHARTQRLLIHLDSKYPKINAEIEALLQRCFLANAVSYARPSVSSWSGRDDTWRVLSVYSSHHTCLLPQHGPGKKHERTIALESWQEDLMRLAPWAFIRGCIWTDGCAFINRTDIHRERPYEYLSYDFANMSQDIVDLFVRACDQVGVFTRVTCSKNGRWDVRINRRESVALMLENVGRKA
jgi:hypothetical protein